MPGYQQGLPTVGGNDNTWGYLLNYFLQVGHNQYGGLYTINSITSSYNIGTTETGYNNPSTQTTSTPIPVANEYFLADATSGNITITLPDATNYNFRYMIYNVKKIDSSSNSITIATTSSQTIDGGSTAVISVPYVSVQIVTNGANWFII